MKKSVIFTFVLLVGLAVAVIFYLNRPSPVPAPDEVPSERVDNGVKPKADEEAQKRDDQKPERPERKTIKVPPTASRKEKVDAFFSNSGIKDAFNTLGTGFQEMSGLMGGELSPDEEEIVKAMKDQFDAQKLSADYQKILDDNFSEEDLDELNRIYQDPDVQRIVSMGSGFGDTDQSQAMADFMMDFKIDSLPRDKREALEDFAEQQLRALPEDHELLDVPDDFKKEFKQIMMEQMISSGAYMFKDSSPEDIEKVVRLLSKPIAEKETSFRARFIMDKAQDVQKVVSSKFPEQN